jgi:hypothetical protein
MLNRAMLTPTMPAEPSTVAAPQPEPLRGCATLWTRAVADLAAILEADCAVAVLRRDPQAVICAYIEAALRSEGGMAGVRRVLDVAAPDYPALLPALPGRDALAADLSTLTTLFADLLGCERIGFRLEVSSAAMCPKFHADRVGLRMLCTYRGPGTEWIDPEYQERPAAMERGSVSRATAFDVVLLKGHAWPGNDGRGAVHRSPDVAPERAPRVLAAFDAVW